MAGQDVRNISVLNRYRPAGTGTTRLTQNRGSVASRRCSVSMVEKSAIPSTLSWRKWRWKASTSPTIAGENSPLISVAVSIERQHRLQCLDRLAVVALVGRSDHRLIGVGSTQCPTPAACSFAQGNRSPGSTLRIGGDIGVTKHPFRRDCPTIAAIATQFDHGFDLRARGNAAIRPDGPRWRSRCRSTCELISPSPVPSCSCPHARRDVPREPAG